MKLFDLGPPTTGRAEASAIRDLGRIVGVDRSVDGTGEDRAITWDLKGYLRELPDFGEESGAFDVSKCGIIVGWAYWNANYSPVRWDHRVSDCD